MDSAIDTPLMPDSARTNEQTLETQNGWAVLGALVLVGGVAVGLLLGGVRAALDDSGALAAFLIVLSALVTVVTFVGCFGFFALEPNQGKVLALFGSYRGTDRTTGLRWANPLLTGAKISLRARNFATHPSKVNDANGNPIVIASVVVWRVVDTAMASFDVDDFEHFVEIQSEAAVRHLAREFPYDSFDDHDIGGTAPATLIGHPDVVNSTLTAELQARLAVSGVEVVEARLTDLSYAPEIAEAMLRRQQAAAIISARRQIVAGAVGMVQDAVERLADGDIEMDADRKATFAANLMTVITSDAPTNPVVNVGTLNR